MKVISLIKDLKFIVSIRLDWCLVVLIWWVLNSSVNIVISVVIISVMFGEGVICGLIICLKDRVIVLSCKVM